MTKRDACHGSQNYCSLRPIFHLMFHLLLQTLVNECRRAYAAYPLKVFCKCPLLKGRFFEIHLGHFKVAASLAGAKPRFESRTPMSFSCCVGRLTVTRP